MVKKLEGKVALVTGASKGIGASIAEHLGELGASVVVNYSTSKEGAERVVQSIKQKDGKAIAIQPASQNQRISIASLLKQKRLLESLTF